MEKVNELFYQRILCTYFKGVINVPIANGLECDIITRDYAMEVDFCHKWAESIGQSLVYASELNLKPGICLIYNPISDKHFVKLSYPVIKKLGIKLYLINYSSHNIYEYSEKETDLYL